MTLEEKDKKALIIYKIKRSEETINEAITSVESEHLNLAANRIYYACFYSVEALFLTEDRSFNSHMRLAGEFNKEFVHNRGLVDEKYSAILKESFEQRQTGDYGDFIRFDKDEIKSSLRQAEEFVREINKITMKHISGN